MKIIKRIVKRGVLYFGLSLAWERLRQVKNSLIFKYIEKKNPGDYYSVKGNDYYKCIFIHIPKSAGISVNKALFGNYGASHTDISFYRKFYHPKTFEKYFKFTFVRNPYSRLYSAFSYLKKGGTTEYDKKVGKTNFEKLTFKEFVLDWLNEDHIMAFLHLKPQYEFLIDRKGNLNIDFIGRYENLDEDFQYIAQRLGIVTRLDRHNVTSAKKKEKIEEIYSNDMKVKVYRLYRKDFELFDYKY